MTITEIIAWLDERTKAAGMETFCEIDTAGYSDGYNAGYFMALCIVKGMFAEIRAELENV